MAYPAKWSRQHIESFGPILAAYEAPLFKDFPLFKPAFTPEVMDQLGVFGRAYFGKASLDDLEGLSPEMQEIAWKQIGRQPSYKTNCFGVKSGMDHEWWLSKGLIHVDDPMGWYHWYCRFHAGRRHSDDERQIRRWLDFRRFLVNGQNQIKRYGACSPVILQALLQWSYNPLDVLAGGGL